MLNAMSESAPIRPAWHLSVRPTLLRTQAGRKETVSILLWTYAVNLAPSHRESHNCVLDVHTVLGLVINNRLRAVDYSIGHLEAPVGRQTMHIDRILFCQRHTALITDPVLVLTNGVNHL